MIGVHPGGFQHVSSLEEGVDEDELMFSAKRKQELPVVIAVANSMLSKDSFPGF